MIKIYMLILASMVSVAGLAQVSISGPQCVVPGTIYQYTITGSWDSVSVMNACVSGGMIGEPADSLTCTPQGPPVARVLISWTVIGNGTLTVTSSLGNASLSVSVIVPLVPGTIDSLSRTQMLAPGDTPMAITCSLASGGSCTPAYNYQWQQSSDRVTWVNMDGAAGSSLTIGSTLAQSTYYRRRVTETSSGTISYSDIASIFVGNF
jgi:hypothetical protein